MNNPINNTANINPIIEASIGTIYEKINMAKEFLTDIEKDFIKNKKAKKMYTLDKYDIKELDGQWT